jgi:hypothetical protein
MHSGNLRNPATSAEKTAMIPARRLAVDSAPELEAQGMRVHICGREASEHDVVG